MYSRYVTYRLDTFQMLFWRATHEYIDSLVQDCSISIAKALDILQSYTKPLISSVCYQTIDTIELRFRCCSFAMDIGKKERMKCS